MDETAIANTSAGDAVRTELAQIMSNPAHSMHEGFKRNDPTVNAYIDGLYRKTYGTKPVNFNEGIEISGTPSTPQQTDTEAESVEREARHAQTQAELRLQQAMGDSYEPELRSARSMAAQLFTTPDSLKVLDEVFTPLISGLGVHAEVLAVRFLADLGRLRNNNQIGGA